MAVQSRRLCRSGDARGAIGRDAQLSGLARPECCPDNRPHRYLAVLRPRHRCHPVGRPGQAPRRGRRMEAQVIGLAAGFGQKDTRSVGSPRLESALATPRPPDVRAAAGRAQERRHNGSRTPGALGHRRHRLALPIRVRSRSGTAAECRQPPTTCGTGRERCQLDAFRLRVFLPCSLWFLTGRSLGHSSCCDSCMWSGIGSCACNEATDCGCPSSVVVSDGDHWIVVHMHGAPRQVNA